MIKTASPDIDRNYSTIEPSGQNARLSELDEAEIWQLFQRDGAILFRGFTLDLQEFDALTAKFCSRFVSNSSPGRQSLSEDGRTQTVNLGLEAFPLHSELSREPCKPDIAFFACATAPPRLGETLLCDGLAIVPALSDTTRDVLQQNLLEHRIWLKEEECERLFGVPHPDAADLKGKESDSGYIYRAAEGKCQRLYYAPALHKPMFSAELVFANFLLFSRYFLKLLNFPTFKGGVIIPEEICAELKMVSDALTVAHRWQKNDLLMVDNTRFMHGRNAVENPAHRIILTQFGYC